MKLFVCALMALLSGCTVYKSSDRDDFDQNGKARATALGLSFDDRDLLANPCGAFNALNDQQITSLFGEGAHLSTVNQISAKTSTCLVTSQAADMSAPTVLACSWKAVDATHSPATGTSLQTTEDDLRSQGFDVVSTFVARGETLRMNCEAYAPTQAVLDDRKDGGEIAANDLHARFRVFSRELARATIAAPLVNP